MRWLCLLLMTEDVKGLDQQHHMYSIHSKANNCHAEEIIEEKNTSLSMLNAGRTDEENPGASYNIPRGSQVQCYGNL